MEVEHVEAEVEEDTGYFFQRLGEVRFTKESQQAPEQAPSHCLAMAARHGVTAFADATGKQGYCPVIVWPLDAYVSIKQVSHDAGVHIVPTAALVGAAVKGDEGG
jgi:hypothetical protein